MAQINISDYDYCDFLEISTCSFRQKQIIRMDEAFFPRWFNVYDQLRDPASMIT